MNQGDASLPNDSRGGADDLEVCTGGSVLEMGCNNGWGTDTQVAARSMHVGGLQVLMGDGSVRFISQNINAGDGSSATSPTTWWSLHTRGMGEVIGNF